MTQIRDDSVPESKNAVLYLRVSTEEQVDNFSLDTQEDICKREAIRRGYTITEIFREEGRSAKTILGRPTLLQMLEYCHRNKRTTGAVFIYRLDRISRQTADYLAIRKKLTECDITLISATEPTGNSPTEKLVETMLAGFAQLDNDVRSERTRNGMRARFLSGLFNGRPPAGYLMKAGIVTKDPEGFDKMKEAWELMATGTKSLIEMTKVMNGWDLRSKVGTQSYLFTANTLDRIFRMKFYMGIISSQRYPEEVKGQHAPMVTAELFYKVQAILDGRNLNFGKIAKHTRDNPTMPLRRIVKCAACDIGLTGGWTKGRSAKYAYYRCSRRCSGSSTRVDVLENKMMELLKSISPTDQCIELFTYYMYKCYAKRITRQKNTQSQADAEIKRLTELRQSLIEKNLRGIYSDDIFKEQSAIIEEKMTTAYLAKSDTLLENYDIDKIIAFMKGNLSDLGNLYKNSNIDQIKVLLGSTFTSGLTWDNSGRLNHQISPVFQAVRDADRLDFALGDPNGIRTRVAGMKAQRPRPLDDGAERFGIRTYCIKRVPILLAN
ncbi:MAG: hypothetical protein RI947_584 [Candidatus Parcubacteria bacterium]